AAGETRLFAFAHAYRNRERSRLHHPEFTMLEWYRAGAPYQQLMQDCAEILRLAAAAGDGRLRHRGLNVDPTAAPERVTLADDFLAALGQMPVASGIALGFDRLVMLATGAEQIEQVLWTPVVG